MGEVAVDIGAKKKFEIWDGFFFLFSFFLSFFFFSSFPFGTFFSFRCRLHRSAAVSRLPPWNLEIPARRPSKLIPEPS